MMKNHRAVVVIIPLPSLMETLMIPLIKRILKMVGWNPLDISLPLPFLGTLSKAW